MGKCRVCGGDGYEFSNGAVCDDCKLDIQKKREDFLSRSRMFLMSARTLTALIRGTVVMQLPDDFEVIGIRATNDYTQDGLLVRICSATFAPVEEFSVIPTHLMEYKEKR